jgi:uncharacterized protein
VNILFFVNTPAQAHTWIPIINKLKSRGHEIKILARDYGSTIELFKASGLVCDGFKPISKKYFRIFEIFVHVRKGYLQFRKSGINMVIGFGVDAAFTAGVIRQPSIIFTDNDPTHLQNNMTNWFASAIITPDCFLANLGEKQVRIKGYKELAYLHPNYFKPDSSIYDELKINRGEKYVILRFNIFDAVHDIGVHGFSPSDQVFLVKELERYAHVFISPEGNLSEELERYRLPISYNRIHHALYYAHLLVTDTQTMATEAAILGTPVVRCNSFVGSKEMGNFIDLEQKYDLVYSYSKTEQAKIKAIELIKQLDLKEQWDKKRQVLLSDKIDVTKFMVEFIDNFPRSLSSYISSRGNK